MDNMTAERPESGVNIPAGWHERLWNDVRARTLRGDKKTVRVNRTPNGTTIAAVRQPQSVGGGSAGYSYSGFFACSDSSTTEGSTTTLKVSVAAGHATFNDTGFDVPAEEITVTASGFLFLKSTIGVDDPPLPLAPEFEYVTSWPEPEDGVGRRLIATVAIGGNSMTITQQHHGEVQAFIWGTCEEEEEGE